jgi:hypothetical protein
MICRNCNKEYHNSDAKDFPIFYCSIVCEKTAQEKNYDNQVKYSESGKSRSVFESNRIRGQY